MNTTIDSIEGVHISSQRAQRKAKMSGGFAEKTKLKILAVN
jgi:hypothetical protein